MNKIKKKWRQCHGLVWQCETRIYITALRLFGRLPGPQQKGETASGKIIYLTFDDGPGNYTERLLDVLARYNVKATFFVTNGPNHLDILPRISAAGHSIGNHTANHDYKTLYKSEASFLDALCNMEKLIQDQIGIRPTLFRFPGGSISINYHAPHKGMAHTLTALVQNLGYHYFDWDVDSRDTAEAQSPRSIYRNVISGVCNRKHTVVLQHDINQYSVDAVERILVWGIKNGYTFLPLHADSPAVHHVIND